MRKEDNERICRIGSGTPMGEVFRRYWVPICLTSQLPTPASAPMAQTLLGENFVVFRNTEGKVGVLDELCMHRGASLALGRVEDCGIRCIYHGWKFGVDGEVLDILNNGDERMRKRFRANAYPVEEAGGIVWTYLGPKEKQPPFPRFSFMDLAPEYRVNIRLDIHANWVQATEGGLDSSHVGILHTNAARPSWNGASDEKVGAMTDTAPVLEIEDTEFGYHYGAIRCNEAGEPSNVRIVPFFMPSGRIIPDIRDTGNATIVFEIPLDDEHTATYSVRYGPRRPIPRMERLTETGFDDPEFYSESECKFLFTRNDFHRQRRDQMDKTWSGFRGIALEDAVIATSMGPIYDRTKEHLIASDLAIVRFRRRLMESIELVERGEDPIGVHADHHAISAIDTDLPKAGHWRTLLPSHKVVGLAA